MKTRILMVCLGNICRSPLAEGIMQSLISKHELQHLIEVDSAGTCSDHVGSSPDTRSANVAELHGFKLNHKGRHLVKDDLTKFDHILVMDHSNLANTLKLSTSTLEEKKVSLITKYDSSSNAPSIVKDPYWGTPEDFENVYQQLLSCCEGWLKAHFTEHISEQLLNKVS